MRREIAMLKWKAAYLDGKEQKQGFALIGLPYQISGGKKASEMNIWELMGVTQPAEKKKKKMSCAPLS